MVNQDKFRLFTEDPGALIPVVADLSRRHGAKILSLDTPGPSLEDVFIRVTGLDVRVAQGGAKNEVA